MTSPALVEAHAAARSGDLDRAAGLLQDLTSAAALDLRARLHAQRGELAEAHACWSRVLVLLPGDAGAEAGRERIARIRAGRPARPLLTPARLTVLAALLATATIAWIPFAADDAGLPPAATPVAVTPATVTPVGTPPAEIPRPRNELDRIAAGLRIPGVRTERRASDVRLVFTSGLFTSGTELAPGARAQLARVGRKLSTLEVTTTVVGHTVAFPGGRARGGSVTAYARAQVAAQELADAAGLPLTAFTLATAEQSAGPFREAARNRTVTLILSPNQ